jgi:hypothetical protein
MSIISTIKSFFMSEEIVRLNPCPAECNSTAGCEKCLVPGVLKVSVQDESKAADKFGRL